MTNATEILVDFVLALAASDMGKALREAHQERLAKRYAAEHQEELRKVEQQLADQDRGIRRLENQFALERRALEHFNAMPHPFDKLS